MQFIFGNNKSKYDLLYTDDKREDASSVLNILKIPFAPTEEYDVYGYVPFGTNSNRPLFFHCQKDTELSRSVYFLHGIYRELSSEYFFSDEYMSDLCAGFIGQESFNSLREQSEGFSYTVNTDAALLQTARNGVEISETKLKTIVYHLYQRQKVILVMDDEAYDTNYIRALMCTIFKYLPPSLRKICSFITGMTDTGPVEFLINIIPRSMYKKDRNVCVDLSINDAQEVLDPKAEKVFSLLPVDDKKRENAFKLFETVYYGRVSTFKKQTFAEFLSYLEKPTREERYDLLMDRFVGDDRYDESIAVPAVILKYLKPLFDGSEDYRQQIVSQSTFDPYRPLGYYFDGVITIRKLYLLGDQKLDIVRAYIDGCYDQVIKSDNIDSFERACQEYRKSGPDITRLDQAIEKQFYTVLGECIEKLAIRVKKYREWTSVEKVENAMSLVLNRNQYEILTPERMGSMISGQLSKTIEHGALDWTTYKINIRDDFKKKASEVLERYNVEARKQKENERLDRENRTVVAKFEETKQYLSQALMAATKEADPSDAKGKKDDALAKENEAKYEEAYRAYYPLLIESCSFDERFAPERAICMARHIICSYMVNDHFFDQPDEVLRRLADKENMQHIAGALAVGGGKSAGLCFPYIACYGTTAADIINLLMHMVRKGTFKSFELKSSKKYMDLFLSIVAARMKQNPNPLALKAEELDAIQKRCKKLAEAESSNKVHVAIADMLQSFIKRIRAQQKKIPAPLLWGGVALGVVLAAGITLAIIFLAPADGANGGEGETTADTAIEVTAEETAATTAAPEETTADQEA